MAAAYSHPFRWLLRSCLALLVLAGLLLVVDEFTTDEQLVHRVQQDWQQDFTAALNHIRSLSPAQLEAEANLPVPQAVRLQLSPTGKLLYWSTQQLVPPRRLLLAQLSRHTDELLQADGLVFYNLKSFTDSLVEFRLVPLAVTYPLQHDQLENYLYLGRYTPLQLGATIASQQQSAPCRGCVQLRGKDGSLLLTVNLQNLSPIRNVLRLPALLFAIAALVLASLGLYRWLKAQLKQRWQAEACFVAYLLIIRLLLLWAELSLEDPSGRFWFGQVLPLSKGGLFFIRLTLNLLLLTLTTRALQQSVQVGQVAQWLIKLGKGGWLGFHLLATCTTLALYLAYSHFFEYVNAHTHTYFQFWDLYALEANAALLLLNAVLLLYNSLSLQAFTIQLSIRTTTLLRLPALLLLAWPVVGLALLDVLPTNYLLVDFVAYGGFLFLLYVLYSRYGGAFYTQLMPALLLMVGLACLTTLSLYKSLASSTLDAMQQIAKKYAATNDVLTEHVFDDVVTGITNDASLWQEELGATGRPIPARRVQRLINNHLAPNLMGYQFRVFFFDEDSTMLAAVGQQPYPFTRQTPQEQTASRYLHYVPNAAAPGGYLYVGRFNVATPSRGLLQVQVELTPKANSGTRLYPQLLWDESLKEQLKLPPGYQVATYRNRYLQRSVGSDAFLAMLPDSFSTGPQLTADADSWQYSNTYGQAHTVIVRAPKPGWFDLTTAFCFWCYVYLLAYVVRLLPSLATKLLQQRFKLLQRSFALRIQFFIAVLGFLPLLAMGVLTSPLFERLYVTVVRDELSQQLKQVAGDIELADDYVEHITLADYALPSSSDLIYTLGRLLSTDINIYNLNGELYNTTRSGAYPSLSATIMHPLAYSQLSKGLQTELVVQERLGGLQYLAGYIPLHNRQGNIAGFLNLPYLAQQGIFEDQMRKFGSYLINIYMVLLLGILLSGAVISNTLTEPLKLLKQKLDQTGSGAPTEPLSWASEDEIGAIIESYNQMLLKIEASEKQLARTQRETAWREMARQVAHEIKNPLTPMRLSIQHLLRTLQSQGNQEQQSLASRISVTLLTQVEALTNIANSFSQFANLPQQEHTLVSLNEVLASVHLLHQASEEAQVELNLATEPLWMVGDREQLNRIFLNLTTNALQAMSGRGKIVLRLFRELDRAVVAVTDDGRGIAPEVQPKIFEPNFSTKTSGMGLGLAITRRLVESMEGNIRFVSTVGLGTTFYVSFPLHAAPTASG